MLTSYEGEHVVLALFRCRHRYLLQFAIYFTFECLSRVIVERFAHTQTKQPHICRSGFPNDDITVNGSRRGTYTDERLDT